MLFDISYIGDYKDWNACFVVQHLSDFFSRLFKLFVSGILNTFTISGSGRFQINQNTLKIVSSEEDYKVVINDVLDTWFNENDKYTYGPFTGYEDEFGDYLRVFFYIYH